MPKQGIFFIIFVSLIFSTWGCNKEKKNDLVLNENVLVIDDAVQMTIDASTITVPASQAEMVEEVKSGSIIVSGKDGGFIRRVISVEQNSNEIVFHTEQASLADAIKQGEIKESIPLTFSDDPLRKDVLGLNFSGETLVSEDGLTITLSQARLKFTPDFNLDFSIGLFSFKYLKVEAKGNISGALAVQISYSGNISLADSKTLYESDPIYTTIKVPVGTIIFPIVFATTLKLEVGYDISFDAGISAEAGASFNSDVSIGAEYRNGAWTPISEQDFQFSPIGPTINLNAGANCRVYLRPSVTFKVYGIIGPTLSVEPYARVNLQVLPVKKRELYLGAKGAISINIEIFDKRLPPYNVPLFDFEKPILSCEDADADGHEKHTEDLCSMGDDYCDDDDPDHWAEAACNNQNPQCYVTETELSDAGCSMSNSQIIADFTNCLGDCNTDTQCEEACGIQCCNSVNEQIETANACLAANNWGDCICDFSLSVCENSTCSGYVIDRAVNMISFCNQPFDTPICDGIVNVQCQ